MEQLLCKHNIMEISWVSTHAGQNSELCLSAHRCLPATLWYMCLYMYYTLYFQCVQVYYYKIPTDIDLVTVEASSETYGCTVVSIQNNTVSVFLVTLLCRIAGNIGRD